MNPLYFTSAEQFYWFCSVHCALELGQVLTYRLRVEILCDY